MFPIYIIPVIVILVIYTFIFVCNIRIGILSLFGIGVSVQYLYRLKFGSFSALELVGISLPVLIICGLLYNRKKILNEFNETYIFKHFFILLTLLLFTGVLFNGLLYDQHSFTPFMARLGAWCKLMNGFIVMIATCLIFSNEKKVDIFFKFILISLIVPGSIFVWQITTGATEFSKRVGYSFAFAYFHHPGTFAYYLLFCVPACLFRFSRSVDIKEKFLNLSLVLLLIILIYFTYRRGVWLGLFTQLFTYFFILQKFKYKMLYGYLIGFVVAVMSFSPVISTFADRLSDISVLLLNFSDAFYTDTYDTLFSGRWRFFRANIFFFFKQPILNMMLGNGIGGTHYASSMMGTYGGDHNIYLILLMDYGLISFLTFITFIFAIVRKLWRYTKSTNEFIKQYSKVLFTLFSSFIVVGLITHVIYGNATNWIIWGMTGVFLGLLKNENEYFYEMEI